VQTENYWYLAISEYRFLINKFHSRLLALVVLPLVALPISTIVSGKYRCSSGHLSKLRDICVHRKSPVATVGEWRGWMELHSSPLGLAVIVAVASLGERHAGAERQVGGCGGLAWDGDVLNTIE
jgi:hypothetical protein